MTPSNDGKSPGVSGITWLLLVVALAVAVLIVATRGKVTRKLAHVAQDPLALVPAGPRLLISADVASLVKVAASDLARIGGDKLLGLRKTCGFEPLLSLERAVFAMPFAGAAATERGSDFALVASTRIDEAAGLKCAESVIKSRGGSPSRSQLGKFTSVRDLSKPAGEVALRPDGTFVLSGGQYFRDVMDAAAGSAKPDEAAKLRTQLHRSLRDKLGAAQLVLTLLPEATSPLRGVAAIGLAIEIGTDVALRGLVACASTEACNRAREVIDSTKTELAGEPGLSSLSSLKVEQRAERLELSARLPREQLGPLLSQLAAP